MGRVIRAAKRLMERDQISRAKNPTDGGHIPCVSCSSPRAHFQVEWEQESKVMRLFYSCPECEVLAELPVDAREFLAASAMGEERVKRYLYDTISRGIALGEDETEERRGDLH